MNISAVIVILFFLATAFFYAGLELSYTEWQVREYKLPSAKRLKVISLSIKVAYSFAVCLFLGGLLLHRFF